MSDWLLWVLVLGLLGCSAFLSASETALFSLDREARERVGARTRALLEHPRELLITILFGNLLVNVLFFTFAPKVLPGQTWVVFLSALVGLLVMGEILPKTIALRTAPALARLATTPLTALLLVLAPVRRVVGAFLEFSLRLLGESDRREVAITPKALGEALERSAGQGQIAPGEADLLAEIVELTHLRVREIMVPRVDVPLLDVEDDAAEREAVVQEALRGRWSTLPVVRGEADQVLGQVRLRDLLVHGERALDEHVQPVVFVPEVGGVLSMLATLREAGATFGIAVDEWGGTAGVVTLEHLFEEIVGELRAEDEHASPPVIPMGEGRYRVSGELSIRDWNERLGVDVVPHAFETVGGLVLAVLGRLPSVGDRVELGGGLVGEVSEVRRRRVRTVDLFLEAPPA